MNIKALDAATTTESTASEQSETSIALTSIRYHYMDSLRALAMLVGVLFHTILSYGVYTHDIWPTADTSTSPVVDIIAWFLHTFRMPLFFLVAGFFAHYLVIKKGLWGFVKNRALRILLPFIIFWPLVIASILATLYCAAFIWDVDTPIVKIVKMAFENSEADNGDGTGLSTAHLWFIYYLSIFCFTAACAKLLFGSKTRINAIAAHPIFLLLAMPLLTTLSLLKVHLPFPAPETVMPLLWAFTFFGLFFYGGWIIFSNQHLIKQFQAYWWYLVLSSIGAYTIFIYLFPEPITFEVAIAGINTSPPFSWSQLGLAAVSSILAWNLTFLSLIGAYKYLNWQSSVLRYVTDASYWIYIIHIPLVFLAQAYFHTLEWPILVELLIMSFAIFTFGFLTYATLVRPTPIGWMLNGRNKKQNPLPLKV